MTAPRMLASTPHSIVRSAIAVALVATSLLAGCASSPPPRPVALAKCDYSWFRQYMAWLVERQMRSAGVTGLSVAVVDDQEVVWQQGFGFADKERKVPADAHTVYSAGSISKVFTATAVMQLVEQGKLDLDRPLTDYLPELAIRNRFPEAGPVTLRGLLTHHSGLPSDRFREFFFSADTPQAQVEAALARLPSDLRNEWLARPPGSAFAYSNIGFSLAGATVARASGLAFPDYLRQHVLAPAGMTRSSFRRADVGAQLAKGYSDGDEFPLPNLRDLPAGGLLSSASDLALFMRMVFAGGRGAAGEVLKPGTVAEMLRPQNEAVPLDLDFRIGLGWWLDGAEDKPLGRMAAHGGDLPPYHAAMLTLPDTKIGVVLLSNSEEAAAILMSLSFETARRAVEAKTGVLPPMRQAQPVEVANDVLERDAGIYASGIGVSRVERSSGRLRTEFAGTPIHLVPRDDHRFGLQYRLLGLFPLPIDALSTMSVSFHEVGERKLQALRFGPVLVNVGERVAPQPEPSAAWKARLGRYDVTSAGAPSVFTDPELVWDEDLRVMLLRGKLVLVNPNPVAVGLAPFSDTEATTLGVSRNGGELLRCPDADTCWFSGFQLKRRR